MTAGKKRDCLYQQWPPVQHKVNPPNIRGQHHRVVPLMEVVMPPIFESHASAHRSHEPPELTDTSSVIQPIKSTQVVSVCRVWHRGQDRSQGWEKGKSDLLNFPFPACKRHNHTFRGLRGQCRGTDRTGLGSHHQGNLEQFKLVLKQHLKSQLFT